MEENQVSRTALLSAYFRGYHSKYINPKIFDDFLANELLREEERTALDQYMMSSLQAFSPELSSSFPDQASAIDWLMQVVAGPPQILSRARYAEDFLVKAVKNGVKQYVILGAGMDTFAFRHPEILENLQVFEIDHPAMQAYKCHRLDELRWDLPANLHMVPVDFSKLNLASALMNSSYDPKAATFFSWLGVTYYLSCDTVFSTFRSIVDIAQSDSKVVFEYLDAEAFIPKKAALRAQAMLYGARQMNENMNAGFDPSVLSEKLSRLGLHLIENLSPSDIQCRYFQGRTDKYYAMEHMHFACAVVE